MQSLILKLQADVAARKQPRSEFWPALRVLVLIGLLSASAYELGAKSVDSSAGWMARVAQREHVQSLSSQIETLRGTIDLQKAQIERLERAYELSTRYGIGAELAMSIEEIALAEGVDPELAFGLVQVESEFNGRAVSPVGAVGYTQLMPATAKILAPELSRSDLFDRETNLRLGFRFFRSLLDYYKGDVRLALLAYNRGPGIVDRLLQSGIDPSNGYARKVLSRRAAD